MSVVLNFHCLSVLSDLPSCWSQFIKDHCVGVGREPPGGKSQNYNTQDSDHRTFWFGKGKYYIRWNISKMQQQWVLFIVLKITELKAYFSDKDMIKCFDHDWVKFMLLNVEVFFMVENGEIWRIHCFLKNMW